MQPQVLFNLETLPTITAVPVAPQSVVPGAHFSSQLQVIIDQQTADLSEVSPDSPTNIDNVANSQRPIFLSQVAKEIPRQSTLPTEGGGQHPPLSSTLIQPRHGSDLPPQDQDLPGSVFSGVTVSPHLNATLAQVKLERVGPEPVVLERVGAGVKEGRQSPLDHRLLAETAFYQPTTNIAADGDGLPIAQEVAVKPSNVPLEGTHSLVLQQRVPQVVQMRSTTIRHDSVSGNEPAVTTGLHVPDVQVRLEQLQQPRQTTQEAMQPVYQKPIETPPVVSRQLDDIPQRIPQVVQTRSTAIRRDNVSGNEPAVTTGFRAPGVQVRSEQLQQPRQTTQAATPPIVLRQLNDMPRVQKTIDTTASVEIDTSGFEAGNNTLSPHRGLASTSQIPQLSLGSRLESVDWSNNFADKVQQILKGDFKQAEIRLDPPHLGKIDVRIDLNSDRTAIIFHADQAVVREAIDHSATRLREQLATAGFGNIELGISSGDAQKNQRGRRDGNGGGAGQYAVDDEGVDGDIVSDSQVARLALNERAGSVNVYA